MTKKNPSLGRQGAGQTQNLSVHPTSNLAYHPSIDRLTLQTWTKPRSLIIDTFIVNQLDLFSPDSIKHQIRSVGISPSCCHCGCKRGYLFKGKLLLCCRCDLPVVKGGSNQ
jgi:hypothetical protein